MAPLLVLVLWPELGGFMPEKEQRRAARAVVESRCRGVLYGGHGDTPVVLRNISTAGAKLELDTEVALDVGDMLRLELTTPYGGCACEARLAWQSGTLVGVEFTELPIDEDDPLNRFVQAPGILHWLWRSFWDVGDRREAPRAHLTTDCPVSLIFENVERSAAMRNLSEGGAMMQLDNAVSFPPGSEVDLTIKTPYGDSHCRARIVWTRQTNEDAFLAGVQFIDLAGDDPLRALMDAPF